MLAPPSLNQLIYYMPFSSSDHPLHIVDEWSTLVVVIAPLVSLLYDFAIVPLLKKFMELKVEKARPNAQRGLARQASRNYLAKSAKEAKYKQLTA